MELKISTLDKLFIIISSRFGSIVETLPNGITTPEETYYMEQEDVNDVIDIITF